MRDLPRGYSLVREIRKGGMTDLYVARNPEGEQVVVRFIKKNSKDRRVKKSFLDGEKILKKLSHPNIVRFLDAGKNNGRLYMVVEYHENQNLRERLTVKDPLVWQRQLLLLQQLASALSYVHNQGYLHLDLKPENILIGDDGTLTLVDFDLASPHKNKEQRFKTVSGTPSYLAPETIRDGILSQRSEIYVFGAVAYELLTANKPYPFDNPDEYPKKVASKRVTVTPFQTYRDNIPPALVTLVLKCLEKEPDRRYPSMALVARDLQTMA